MPYLLSNMNHTLIQMINYKLQKNHQKDSNYDVRIYFTFFSFIELKITIFGEILALNSWIKALPPNQHVFFLFQNFQFLLGKTWKK